MGASVSDGGTLLNASTGIFPSLEDQISQCAWAYKTGWRAKESLQVVIFGPVTEHKLSTSYAQVVTRLHTEFPLHIGLDSKTEYRILCFSR